MSKHTDITFRIGNVWVDSGQMMLGDPCYFSSWKDGPAGFDRPGEYSYAGACTASCSDDKAGILGNGLAAVFSTGYGDGSYPVDVIYNSDGRVVAVTIRFDDGEEKETEQCGHCGDTWVADELDGDRLCPECYEIGDDND